jgi:MFS family permease
MVRRDKTATREPLPQGFFTIWLTVALDLVGFGIVVPILGRYAERYGASGLEVGLLFASFSLAQLVFSPILGKLSDRIGRKPVILISLLGTAIGSFVTGAAGALWVLFLGRIIDGASGAWRSPKVRSPTWPRHTSVRDCSVCSGRRSAWASWWARHWVDWLLSVVNIFRSTWPEPWL